MSYSLENTPEIYKLAQELMAYTGESLPQTIIKALEEQLKREKEKVLGLSETQSFSNAPYRSVAVKQKPFSHWWAEQRASFPAPKTTDQFEPDPRFAYLAERYNL